jgi:hypothetical protein
VEGADKYETGTNVTRTTKKTPLTTFMKGEELRLFLSFLLKSDKFSDFFDIAGQTQNTYIVVKYKIHLYSLRNRPEKLAIVPVSKARTNKFYIYRQCTYIVYILGINGYSEMQ